jgi:predicted GIY-YIG superfamily endonuclease
MTVYLLHFLEPIGNPANTRARAQHYLGYSPEPATRLMRHATGDGAKIVRYVMRAGIGFVVAQTWEGGVELEKRLKRRHDAPRQCEVCRSGELGDRVIFLDPPAPPTTDDPPF